MKVSLLFAWYDLWIDFFYDKNRNWLYILPVPMFGIILKLPHKRYWLFWEHLGKTYCIGNTVSDELEHCLKEDPGSYGKAYWAWNGETKPIFGKDYNEEE